MKYSMIFTLLFLLTGCQQQAAQLKMNTYYSSNKSFSIDVPVDYTQHKEALTSLLVFLSEKQKGSILVERKLLMGSDDFRKYINTSKGKIPSKFHCSTVATSDSIHHYKYTSGMFVSHQFYMMKIVDGYSYVVSFDGTNISKNTAIAIYNSITSY